MISKAITRRGPVKLSRNRADLQRAIETLRAPKEERKQRQRQGGLTRVSTERIENQAAMLSPELQPEGDAVPMEPIDALHAQSSRLGAKPSLGGGSTSHSDE